MNSFPCTVCGEAGHGIRRCPALSDPLKNEFYKPSGGRPVGGDDDDEKIEQVVCPPLGKSQECLNRSFPSAMLSVMRHSILNPILEDMEYTWRAKPLPLSLSVTGLPMEM